MRPGYSILRLTAVIAAASVSSATVQLPTEVDGPAHICFSRARAAIASPPRSAKAKFGTVSFVNSCSAAIQPALQTAIARLHSFDAGIETFRAIAAKEASCVLALWGGAMAARGNPLAGEPSRADLDSGRKLLDRAAAIKAGTPRERAFIDALDPYFRDYPGGHVARTQAYEAAMAALHDRYPGDIEASTFYALAILEAVDLTDKTYARQLKAGAILEPIVAGHPDHPGAPHYLIHAYDYAPLASRALPAARLEAQVAPAAPHAQHMPAHIYTILGMWDDSIEANRRAALVLDPGNAGDSARSDIEDLHGFDFIVTARLQDGQDKQVAADLAALGKKHNPFTVGEARYALERGDWKAASSVKVTDDPFDAAIARFARGYGAARRGDPRAAELESNALQSLREPLRLAYGDYWAGYIDIYALAVRAWIDKAAGNREAAIASMSEAAAKDDAREKSINLENKLLPMREVLGELLLAQDRPQEAADAFMQSLQTAPNRFRTFAGMARAARVLGDQARAREWYGKLVTLTAAGDGNRPELMEAKAFLRR